MKKILTLLAVCAMLCSCNTDWGAMETINYPINGEYTALDISNAFQVSVSVRETEQAAVVTIGEKASVGDNTEIYSNAVVYHDCKVGNNCILHAGCVIGADGFGFAPSEEGYEKIPQIGIVTIEDNVEIGANTTIDCSTMGSTRVCKGVKIDNLVHLAHNVVVGENTAMAAQVGVSGSTHLGKNCVIGGQSGFVGHITIADGSKFGGQSGVMGSIKQENQEFMGTPIQPLRQYLVSNARFRHIDEMARKLEKLEKDLAELRGEKRGK